MAIKANPVAVKIETDPLIPAYPMVMLLARRGRALTYLLGVLIMAFSLGYAGLSDNWLLVLIVLPCTVVIMALLLSYVELLQIVSDTLMPR